MILADTSIWIGFFRQRGAVSALGNLLRSGQIVIHPCVIAELALGSLQNRERTLADLEKLPRVPMARISEIRRMIEARRLYARGIGLTDAHLVASCLISPPTLLWTSDSRLGTVADAMGIRVNLP
jgi:predicted nucleic acid-binding protein